jgi:hypothetical protein
MGYRVLTFNFSIGDTGVTQTDDGSGGTVVNLNGASLTPPAGWTIINVVSVTSEVGSAAGPISLTAPSDDGSTPWIVYAYTDSTNPYPMASSTPAYQVIAIAGDSPLYVPC